MATSPPSCANTDIALLVDLVNEPTVTNAYSGHQSICLLAQQIPTLAASQSSLRNNGLIRD
jgi:hypothetical protein